MTLIPDERTVKEFGEGHRLVYLRAQGANGEGGYEVRFSDGRRVRLVPDGTNSTRKRLHTAQKALVDVEVGIADPLIYLIGACAYSGVAWEVVE